MIGIGRFPFATTVVPVDNRSISREKACITQKPSGSASSVSLESQEVAGPTSSWMRSAL